MSKIVSIIFGAGASFDLFPSDQKHYYLKEESRRPPLAAGLFTVDPSLESILNKYALANTAIARLRHKIADGQSPETLLRELMQSKEYNKIQQFRQIPLYLKELFQDISKHYCNHPANYSVLISETEDSKIEKIAYVTLNYDLFFEQALSREKGIYFDNIKNYISEDKKWMFIKLHGSANWGRRLRTITNPGESMDALLDCVSKIDLNNDLDSDIEVDNEPTPGGTNILKYYPAITVPVDNKYEFNCPQDHVEMLKARLKESTDLLFIGISGKDNDLIDLLKENLTQVNLVTIVGGANVEETKMRIKQNVPQLNHSYVGWRTYSEGFSNFIRKNGLETFVT